MTRFPLITSSPAAAICLLLIQLSSCMANEDPNTGFLRGTNVTSTKVEGIEHEHVLAMSKRMSPHSLVFGSDDGQNPMPSKQVFHLHHMKSGGTSLSSWINCAVSRQRSLTSSHSVPTARLSECSWGSYHRCIEDEKDRCRERLDTAAIATYCSPLAVTNYFNWTDADAVTMIRHPVKRVWSMFRFQTRSCFKCKSLHEIYKDIDDNNVSEYAGGVCLSQLNNHITRNLMQTVDVHHLDNSTATTDEEKVADAINSIKNRFKVVGIIEQLDESIEMFSHAFPWMSEEMEGVNDKCAFPHHNKSPSNNNCGKGGGHWDLPDEPDEETWKLIEEHNDLDMQVYRAALETFELQKKAMILAENEQ